MKERFVSSDQAVPAEVQHEKPCGDCPFARSSIPGWLGNGTPESWIQDVHGEAQINCHTLIGPQCAGGAIYRANVSKTPRKRTLLVLNPDTKLVFASPGEFLTHHRRIERCPK
jgi:hypothetical protein